MIARSRVWEASFGVGDGNAQAVIYIPCTYPKLLMSGMESIAVCCIFIRILMHQWRFVLAWRDWQGFTTAGDMSLLRYFSR